MNVFHISVRSQSISSKRAIKIKVKRLLNGVGLCSVNSCCRLLPNEMRLHVDVTWTHTYTHVRGSSDHEAIARPSRTRSCPLARQLIDFTFSLMVKSCDFRVVFRINFLQRLFFWRHASKPNAACTALLCFK